MKTKLLIVAALGLLLAACNRQESPPAEPKTDLDRLQGTWNLVSATEDGKILPQDKVKQTTIVFKGDTFRFPGSAKDATSKEGTVKLDETKTPKEIDAISTQKEVMLGIYVLQQYGYKVCFAPAGKPRPTDFSSAPGSGYILQSWERKKKQ
ncbi:MAG: TIGR03067 domain-containing protein [Nitrospirota bacterium]